MFLRIGVRSSDVVDGPLELEEDTRGVPRLQSGVAWSFGLVLDVALDIME